MNMHEKKELEKLEETFSLDSLSSEEIYELAYKKGYAEGWEDGFEKGSEDLSGQF